MFSLLRAQTNNGLTCNGSVCSFINRSTDENIAPFPINQAPALTNLYTSLSSRLGSSRITSVKYYGRNELRSRLARAGMAPVEIATILAYGSIGPSTGWLVYTSIDSSGREEEHIIPANN